MSNVDFGVLEGFLVFFSEKSMMIYNTYPHDFKIQKAFSQKFSSQVKGHVRVIPGQMAEIPWKSCSLASF